MAALELTPDVAVRRDPDGNIRQLQHLGRPYRLTRSDMLAAATVATPRSLAEAYIRDAADLLGFAPAATANFAAAAADAPTQAPVELRFKEEKAAGQAVTIAYEQTVLGLPIWNAGMSVRVDAGAMHVMGSHNATHYGVEALRAPTDAPYRPNAMTVAVVAGLLGLGVDASSLVINATRALVYRYDPDERFDLQVVLDEPSDAMTGFGTDTPPMPRLPLPPVPLSLTPGQHYVVTEVLFTLPVDRWGPLNWRAFVEAETGAVLYLRALVACARASVFPIDPVTSSGSVASASSTAALDALRQTVPLFGLPEPSPDGRLALEGEYVRLVNLQPPASEMPSEASPFDFIYSSDTANFAACNAYHHCDGFFRLLDGMGFDVAAYFNNTDFPVPVDPHALKGEVNAAAPGNIAGNGLGRLVFGSARLGTTLGIAADPRVVIHEFGHGILWDHVGSPNFGWAHSPGDSLGAILHDPLSRAPDRFETFPFMNAAAGLSRRHDRDVANGWAWGGSRDDRQYGSEQILSTTLFRVYRAAGGDSSDPAERAFASRYCAYLILKAVSLLSFTTLDPDIYVAALTEADASTGLFEGHPGGAFAKVFRWSFEQQGLYQPVGAARPITQAGAPPSVEVYIDDGRGGHYMPFLEDVANAPAIWNRRAPDGGTVHERAQIGVTNFAYVRVSNRGAAAATELAVRGFKSRLASPKMWPTDWRPLTTARLAVEQPLASGDDVVVGPFAWVPQFEGDYLMFEASAAGDRSTLELVMAGPVPTSRLARLDNNIAVRLL
jgi:hypothetical protein